MLRSVFTNGCFDVLHAGHVHLLRQCRALGDKVIVGLNSDLSVRALGKAPNRPINSERDRMALLRELRCVDDVVLFDEPTPEYLIRTISPDVLVKGSDWRDRAEQVAGFRWMIDQGRSVVFVPVLAGYSTTQILERAR